MSKSVVRKINKNNFFSIKNIFKICLPLIWIFVALSFLLVGERGEFKKNINKQDAVLWESVSLEPGERIAIEFKSREDNLKSISFRFGPFSRINANATFRIRTISGYWFFQDTVKTDTLKHKEFFTFKFLKQKKSKNKLYYIELESTAPISTSISKFIVAGYEDTELNFLNQTFKKFEYFSILFLFFSVLYYFSLFFLKNNYREIFITFFFIGSILNYFINDHRISILFILTTSIWISVTFLYNTLSRLSFLASLILFLLGSLFFSRYNIQVAREIIWWGFVYFVVGVIQNIIESFKISLKK